MRPTTRLAAVLAGAALAGALGLAAVAHAPSSTADRIHVRALRPVHGPEPTAGPYEVSAPTPVATSAGTAHDTPPRTTDAVVRTLVETMSAHPVLASWLATDDLLARFAAAVEAVAGGYSPRRQLRTLRPRRSFVVHQQDEGLVIAASSYDRYDLVADVFGSVDAAKAVSIYRRLEPEIAAAHRQIAWYQAEFEDRLLAAIDHLLEVEVPDGEVAVVRGAVTFRFADPALEGLTDAQRQLLRMGPRNVSLIQGKLRQLRLELTGAPAPPGALRSPDPVGHPARPQRSAAGAVAPSASEIRPTTP